MKYILFAFWTEKIQLKPLASSKFLPQTKEHGKF